LNPIKTIGLLSPFLSGYYFSEITSSIQATVESHGARLIAIRSAGKNFDSPIALDQVDGWIVLLDEMRLLTNIYNIYTEKLINQLSQLRRILLPCILMDKWFFVIIKAGLSRLAFPSKQL
jgi:DNA-binding LacI/PurR family transcriptional regulator